MSPRGVAPLAWLAAALAVVLASWGVGEASLWLDETFTVHDARRSIADIFAMRGEAFGGAHHPPGYFLAVKGALAICGAHEACVRAPSVLANAGLAATIVVLAWRAFGRTAAIVAAVVWPTLPYAIKYAQQARHYSLLALACALALWLAVEAFGPGDRGGTRQRAPRRTFVVLGLCAAAALWIHLFALPFLVGLALACLGWQLARRRRAPQAAASRGDIATALGVAALASAPLVPALWTVWATAGGGQLASRAGPVENAGELAWDLVTFGLDSWMVPLLCLPAFVRGPWSRRGLVLSLAGIAVFPLGGVLVRNPEHFVALRYFMPSLAAVAVLQAAGVAAIVELAASIGRRASPRMPKLAAAGLAAAVLVWPAIVLARLHVAGIAKQYATADFEPWDRVAATIREHAGAGDLTVVVPAALVRFPFEVYALPTAIVDPEAPGFAATLEGAETVFVVTSHIDRRERTALRRSTLRALGEAGWVRRPLEGVQREETIELLAYRRR